VTGRKNSAAALQDTIWYIEQEITYLPGGMATNFYNLANAGGWTHIGDIRVLNLYTDAGLTNRAQDVLASVAIVPAPGRSSWSG